VSDQVSHPYNFQVRGFLCEHSVIWYVLWGGGVSTSPNPQAGGPPLVGFRYCLLNIFAAILHTGGLSSIRNLSTRLALVTGTHLPLGLAGSLYQLLCSGFGSGSYIDSELLNFIYLHYSLGGAAVWRYAMNFSRHRSYAHCYALLASSVPVRNCVLT